MYEALLCAVMAQSSCDQVFFVVVFFALYFMSFLAVQDSSIGDIVSQSLIKTDF